MSPTFECKEQERRKNEYNNVEEQKAKNVRGLLGSETIAAKKHTRDKNPTITNK